MTTTTVVPGKPSSWQIGLGAEGIAGSQFARCGFNVSVLSGPNKPWYDLLVAAGESLLKVAVKGSDDGGWSLIDSYLKRAADLSGIKTNYQCAIDLWLDHHGSRTVCCLVQFEGVAINELPRMYLASPSEIAPILRETAERLGTSTLYEKYEWKSGPNGVERLPLKWAFSAERVQELVTGYTTKPQPRRVLPKRYRTAAIWPASAVVPRISYAKDAAA
jgi:hypothetical protein